MLALLAESSPAPAAPDENPFIGLAQWLLPWWAGIAEQPAPPADARSGGQP